MVSILIAEDEAIERRYLTQLMKTIESRGIYVTASCADGAEAVKEAQVFRPDILIMDIEMPNKNGLEAAKEIRKTLPDSKVLILTAFSEFEYAKEAIRIGVDDYFIKPGSDEELLEKVLSLSAEVEKNRERQDHLLFVEEQLKQYNRILVEEMMASVMFLREEAKQYVSDFIRLQRIAPLYFSCGIIGPGKEMQCDMTAEVGEVFRQEGFQYAGGQCQNELVFLIFSDGVEKFDSIKDKVLHKLLRLCGSRFFCAFSTVYQTPDDILKACQEVRTQIERVTGKSNAEPMQEMIRRYEGSWLEAAVSGTKIDCIKEAIAFSEEFLYQEEGLAQAKEAAYLLYMMLTKDIMQFFNREISFGNGDHIRQKIRQTRNSQALQNVVKEFLEIILATVQQEKNKKEDKLVLLVADYLKEHFQENLSLNGVAEEFHMSSYHLSKMFHKTMKKNFIEYLTELRVQKAKRLLMNGTLTVTDIAFMVGYQDSGYFSKVFRKATGLSPREFSESVSRSD